VNVQRLRVGFDVVAADHCTTQADQQMQPNPDTVMCRLRQPAAVGLLPSSTP